MPNQLKNHISEETLRKTIRKKHEERIRFSLENDRIIEEHRRNLNKPLTNLFGNCPFCSNRFYYSITEGEYSKECSECKKFYN